MQHRNHRQDAMNKARTYIQHLEKDGIYLSTIDGANQFIPWNNVSQFTLNTHDTSHKAIITYKEGKKQQVKINEPFKIAQRIYKVLFNHGDSAHNSLPEFNII